MKTLILTDNSHALKIGRQLQEQYGNIDIFQSPSGPLEDVPRLKIKDHIPSLIQSYNLILSIHCKQIFPPQLVNAVRCINVHPGLNPYNRGWFPQVFSILNGLPTGVTIHEIDEQLDHGAIIVQKEYTLEPFDTSGSAYNKIMALERDLVLQYFETIRDGSYKAVMPSSEGNLNLKKDFDALKCLDLNETATMGALIDRLRALTHPPYRNAYFLDKNGNKIFVKIELEAENQAHS